MFSVSLEIVSTSMYPIRFNVSYRFVWSSDCVSSIMPIGACFIYLILDPAHDMVILAIIKELNLFKSPSAFLQLDSQTLGRFSWYQNHFSINQKCLFRGTWWKTHLIPRFIFKKITFRSQEFQGNKQTTAAKPRVPQLGAFSPSLVTH